MQRIAPRIQLIIFSFSIFAQTQLDEETDPVGRFSDSKQIIVSGNWKLNCVPLPATEHTFIILLELFHSEGINYFEHWFTGYATGSSFLDDLSRTCEHKICILLGIYNTCAKSCAYFLPIFKTFWDHTYHSFCHLKQKIWYNIASIHQNIWLRIQRIPHKYSQRNWFMSVFVEFAAKGL